MLPSISIDDDRFQEYGVIMALKKVWLVLMLWTGLEDLEALGHLVYQERPAERLFWSALGILRRGYLDSFELRGSANASGRIRTTDWDWRMRRKSASEGSGAAVRIGTSSGSDFLDHLGDLQDGVFPMFWGHSAVEQHPEG